MRILVAILLCMLVACASEQTMYEVEKTSTDVLPQTLEPSQFEGVEAGDPYFLSMMLDFDDRPVDLRASVVPIWSKDAVYRYQPGGEKSQIRFDVDDTEAASLSLFVEGITPATLKEAVDACAFLDGDGDEVGTSIDWVVDDEFQSLGDILPYRGSVQTSVARASLPPEFRDKAETYILRLSDQLVQNEIYLGLTQPESAYELGVATERWLYHPSDAVILSAELKDSGEDMRIFGARGFLSPVGGAVSAKAELVTQGQGGTLTFVLPSDASEGRWDLTVELAGESQVSVFQRIARTEIEVVRPHARINDARIRIDPFYGTGAAEVLIDVETMSPDRFSIYGTLTGYTDSGYEVPIAWARSDATLDAGEREVMSLYFSVDDVVHAPVSGPYRLRNLTLASAYRGTIQERRAWTGLETPESWGLSMNRRLNRAMCLVLADAGHLPREECPKE